MGLEEVIDMDIPENQNAARAWCSGLLCAFKREEFAKGKVASTYLDYVIKELMIDAEMITGEDR